MKNISKETNQVVLDKIEQKKIELFELLRALVQIPSITGKEKDIQKFIASHFKQFCDKVDVWDPDRKGLELHPSYYCPDTSYKDRPNVVGIIYGNNNGNSLIINAHSDVVTPGDVSTWDHDPWKGDIYNGRMYGRGVIDDKAGLAAIMLIVQILKEFRIQLKGDLILQSVVGEEWGGGGSLTTLNKGYIADGVIVIEPTKSQIMTVCRGGATFEIIVPGQGAHPIEPEKGISAINKAIKILTALDDLKDIRMNRYKRCIHGEYPNLSPIVVGGIEGQIPQKIPDRCIIKGLIGFPPEESFTDVKKELESFIEKVASLDPWLNEHRPIIKWEGFMKEGCEVSFDHPFVQKCLNSQMKHTVQKVSLGTFRAACDLHFYVRYWGLPGIIFGPGNCVLAHSPNEWIDLNELLEYTKILTTIILDWCNS